MDGPVTERYQIALKWVMFLCMKVTTSTASLHNNVKQRVTTNGRHVVVVVVVVGGVVE